MFFANQFINNLLAIRQTIKEIKMSIDLIVKNNSSTELKVVLASGASGKPVKFTPMSDESIANGDYLKKTLNNVFDVLITSGPDSGGTTFYKVINADFENNTIDLTYDPTDRGLTAKVTSSGKKGDISINPPANLADKTYVASLRLDGKVVESINLSPNLNEKLSYTETIQVGFTQVNKTKNGEIISTIKPKLVNISDSVSEKTVTLNADYTIS